MSSVEKAGESSATEEISPGLVTTDHARLWTPWRMRYVAGGSTEIGCLFCNRLAQGDDVASLMLYRGERVFAIMNLFPYNTGHIMLVPNAHVASPEDADAQTMADLAALRGPALRALRRSLAAEGFNLGLNVGAVAGAGVTDHLHEHVVPRWQGDANFMPILAATMVMPELLPVTYAKLRAELERELLDQQAVTLLIVDRDHTSVLLDEAGALPIVTAADGEPLWRAALRDAHARGAVDTELVGWAGAARAGLEPPALLLRANLEPDTERPPDIVVPRARVSDSPDAQRIESALARLDLAH
jgi:ATP adenylyltransferase